MLRRFHLPSHPDDVRMTIGEHLDELRGCLLRSLVALALACLACIWPAKYLLVLIVRPAVLALSRFDQPTDFLATSPTEAMVMYIKVVVAAGTFLAAPYIIYQVWAFVGAGLYPHERRWAHRVVPLSALLFLGGAAFMYQFVLVLSLRFLVGFAGWLSLPPPQMNWYEQLVLGPSAAAPSTRPADPVPASFPAVSSDPADPQVGSLWFNSAEDRLKFRGVDQTYSVQLTRDQGRPMMQTHFRIGEYLSFVLIMTLAFGLAFQVPLVVVFLVRAGIATLPAMRKSRRIVILVIVIIAGIISPPDLMSHLLLSGPMILLFEIGLLIAARKPRSAQPAS